MPRTPDSLVAALAYRLRLVNSSRRSIERLRASQQLTDKTVEQLYDGLYLNAHTAFESFLESLFMGLLVTSSRGQVRLSNVSPRIIVKTQEIAREILHGKRPYLDWMPYHHTLTRAELYFRSARPFSVLTNNQKQVLDRAATIRNAVAHKSRHSLTQFEVKVLQPAAVRPTERTPAAFLRGVASATPPQTRFETYVAAFLGAARSLTA